MKNSEFLATLKQNLRPSMGERAIREVMEHAESLIGDQRHADLQAHVTRVSNDVLSAVVDEFQACRAELADTRRERNRNRQYVGEAHQILTELRVSMRMPDYDHTIRRCCELFDRVEAMATEVGK